MGRVGELRVETFSCCNRKKYSGFEKDSESDQMLALPMCIKVVICTRANCPVHAIRKHWAYPCELQKQVLFVQPIFIKLL